MMNRILAPLMLSVALAAPAAALEVKSDPRTGAIPPLTSPGEIAINRADGRLFWRMPDGSLGTSTLLNALPSGRRAVEQGQSDDQTVAGRPLSSFISGAGGKTTLTPDAFTGDGSGASAAPPGADLPRKIGEWFGDRANVMAFAGSDLSVRFAKACASLPSTGGTIYLPKGMPQSNGALVCNGKPVSLKGDGPGVSQVVFTSAAAGAAGISLSPGDALRPVTIDGLTLTTTVNQTAGNAAITLRYGVATSNIFKGPRVTNIEIAGVGNNSTYWGKGIDAYNIWGFDFHGIHVRGKDVGGATSFPNANMGAAISITGESGGGCSDGKISGVNVFFARYVGYVSGDCEGLHWTDNTGVAVDRGIGWPDAKGHPSFFISNNHFNAFSTAIAISGAQQGFITSNLLYKWTGSTQDWRGIYLGAYAAGAATYYASDNIVGGNILYGYAGGGAAGGTAIGIDATGGDGNTISGNRFYRMNWNFDFGNAGTTNTVFDNTAVATVQGWQRSIGLNTISRNNNPVQAGADQWFVPLTGGGSVNVGAWFQRFFLAADGAAVTYADFTNAEAGRQITIIGQNANSTIANNARIRLRGGVPFVTSQGSSLTLTYTGEYWQEIGRAQ